jgi:hypothetical protein
MASSARKTKKPDIASAPAIASQVLREVKSIAKSFLLKYYPLSLNSKSRFILAETIAAAIALGLMIGFLQDLLKPDEKPPKSPEKRLGEALVEVLERYRDR